MFLTHEIVVLPFLCSTFLISLTFLCVFDFRKSVKQRNEKKIVIFKSNSQKLNNWDETPPSFERNIPPHEIFGLFLTDNEMETICLESTSYPRPVSKVNITLP